MTPRVEDWIFVAECDCDAMRELAHFPVRLRAIDPDLLKTEAIHGPSGHLLNC